MMLVAVLKGVNRHAALMRAAIAMPGNDHRLGANEAPPAIISAFLGQQLTEICDKLESGVNFEKDPEEAVIRLGVSKIPSISKDNTDRNRTSPFAFTGNKFEFRAVGSSMPISFPVTVVNAAVAEAMGEPAEMLKQRVKSGKNADAAVLELVRETLVETKKVRFEGNNYAEEWVKEAARRGLPNLRKAPEAIAALIAAPAMKLFSGLGILSEAEVHSRHHVMIERYVKMLLIEVEMLGSMIDTCVIPAAIREQQEMATSIRAIQQVDQSMNVTEQVKRLKEISERINSLLSKRHELSGFMSRIAGLSEESEKARLLSSEGVALMQDIRSDADKIEGLVSDEYWPLPKYREMLFIS